MGDQIHIVDLAKDMIRLSGLPLDTVNIKFVGIRPGEKLFEELYNDEEEMLETSHAKVRAAYHRPYAVQVVRQSITDLGQTLDRGDATVRQMLKQIVPEFNNSRSTRPPNATMSPINGTGHVSGSAINGSHISTPHDSISKHES
jgi:FlaA1/EpsC-like NDP-sugar epimerase